MSKDYVAIAVDYYTALGKKEFEEIESYLHPEVQFVAPLAKIAGKEVVFEAAKKFTTFFKTLKVRAKFGSGDQAMIVYDLDCPTPLGAFSAAALLTFKEGLIGKIELFYDARPFEKHKDEIFSKS